MTPPDDRPWTVEEAAEFLGFDVETVRRWARGTKTAAPKLRGAKLGKEWRFDPADVRALVPRPILLSANAKVVQAQMNAAFTRAMRGTA